MPSPVKLFLPLPPTANHIWKMAGKRQYLSAPYQKFKDAVYGQWKDAGEPFLEGRLALHIEIYPADRRKQDISNRIKALEDALKGLLFTDDEQIDQILITRMPNIVANGLCKVSVHTL